MAFRQKLLQAAKCRRQQPDSDEDSSLIAHEPATAQRSLVDVPLSSDENMDDENENREPVEFAEGQTQRGGRTLWHGGYRYTKEKKNYWRCADRKCPTRANIIEDGPNAIRGHLNQLEHTCMPIPHKRPAEAMRQELKQIVMQNPRTKPSKVFGPIREAINRDEVFVAMGNNVALRDMMWRVKHKIHGDVDIADPLKIVLPPALLIHRGKSMLMYDSRDEAHRPGKEDTVMVFCHPKLSKLLARNQKWHLDCTFKAAPKPWKQVLVIGATIKRRMVVCVHALLPGKKSIYYEETLRAVKKAIQPREPSTVMMDFEKGLHKAVRIVFPAAKLTGCMFHYGQAIFRRWKKMHLLMLYANDQPRGEGTRQTFRALLALPLLPPGKVRQVFSNLIANSPPGLESFFNYFATVYIGLTQRELEEGNEAFQPEPDRRSSSTYLATSRSSTVVTVVDRESGHSYRIVFGMPSPRPSTPSMPSTATDELWERPIVKRPHYPIELWNVHDRVKHEIDRTNNALESSHLQFLRGLMHHPSLSELLYHIKEDIDKQADIGRSAEFWPQKRHRKDRVRDDLVLSEINGMDYDQGDLMRHVRFLGHHMQGYADNLNQSVPPMSEYADELSDGETDSEHEAAADEQESQWSDNSRNVIEFFGE